MENSTASDNASFADYYNVAGVRYRYHMQLRHHPTRPDAPSHVRPNMMSRFVDAIFYIAEVSVLCIKPELREVTHSIPLNRANILSSAFFIWASPLISTGMRRPVQMADVLELLESETARIAGDDLRLRWAAEEAAALLEQRQPSFQRVVLNYVLPDLAWVAVWKMGWLLFGLLSNGFLLQALIENLQTRGSLLEGLGYAVAFFFVETARSVCVNRHWLLAVLIGVRLRAGARFLLFAKALRLSGADGSSSGSLVQLISGDASRLLEACNFAEFLLSTWVTCLAVMAILIYLVGPAALAGFAVLLSSIPLQAWLGRRVSALRRRTAAVSDERTSLMGEILLAARLIKLYAFEAPFAQRIAAVRAREVARLRDAALVRGASGLLAFAVPALVLLAVFSTNALTQTVPLRPSTAFVVIALFNLARFPLGVFPQAQRTTEEGRVALQRMQAFLNRPESAPEDAHIVLPLYEAQEEIVASAARERAKALTGDASLPANSVAVSARGASFFWSAPPLAPSATEPTSAALSAPEAVTVTMAVTEAAPREPPPPLPIAGIINISFEIPIGALVAVTGPVGAGKSTLLEAILGGLHRRSGAFFLRGRAVCAPQTPWIFPASLRENILFGAPYQGERYREVVNVCALASDIAALPHGDSTEIGERGTNLSGGQKARIGLARALYAHADVYLLDDVLSAVDASVGEAIWRDAVRGFLKGKTVILVTHARAVVSGAGFIISLKNGCIVSAGPNVAPDNNPSTSTPRDVDMPKASTQATPPVSPAEGGTATATPPVSPAEEDERGGTDTPCGSTTNTLIVAEERAVGAVSASTWITYLKAASGAYSGVIGLSLAFLLVLGKGAYVASNAVIAMTLSSSRETFLRTYAGTVFAVVLFTALQSGLFALVTTRASATLHATSFTSVLCASPQWFETQPTGRILSRFSGDIDALDSALPVSLEAASEFVTLCGLSLLLLAIVFPAFLGPLIPLVLLFFYLTRIFKALARELKRLDNLSRGPLVSAAAAASAGLFSIRVFGRGPAVKESFAAFTDISSRTYWSLYAANRHVAIRVDMLTSATSAIIAAFCCLFRDVIPPATAALAVTSALSLAGVLQYTMRLTTDLESALTCVERLAAYSDGKIVDAERLVHGPDLPLTDGEAANIVAKARGGFRQGL